MAEQKNYRFRDLEANPGVSKREQLAEVIHNGENKSVVTPTGKSFRDMVTNVSETREKDKPVFTAAPEKKIDVYEKLDTIENLIRSLSSKVEKATITQNIPEKDDTDDEKIDMYTSIKYPNIEYFLIRDLIVVHDTKADTYTVGDVVYSEKTFEEVVDDIVNSDPSSFDCDKGTTNYEDEFILMCIGEICDHLETLTSIFDRYETEAPSVSEKYAAMMIDLLPPSYISSGNIDETEYGEEVDTVPDEQEAEEESQETYYELEEETNEPTAPVDVPDMPVADTNESLEDLADIEEVDEEKQQLENSSLHQYAAAIENKIPDDEVQDALTKARASRRDRSIQLEYTPPKK